MQPSVIRISKGGDGKKRLLAFFRSRKRDNVWWCKSKDDGKTWTTPHRTVLPQQNKAVQAIALSSGNVALAFDNNR